jgi:hypothetical protein
MQIRAFYRIAAAVVLSLAWVGAEMTLSTVQAASKPVVVHEQFAFPGADLGVVNICGDLADFRFWTEGSFTSVDVGDGVFHLQVVSRGTYTVTFLDTAKGVWEATIQSASSVQATPGGTFTTSQVANTFEGPVRIHEQTTFVVGADGTIHVDHYAIDVAGCPSE